MSRLGMATFGSGKYLVQLVTTPLTLERYFIRYRHFSLWLVLNLNSHFVPSQKMKCSEVDLR